MPVFIFALFITLMPPPARPAPLLLSMLIFITLTFDYLRWLPICFRHYDAAFRRHAIRRYDMHDAMQLMFRYALHE